MQLLRFIQGLPLPICDGIISRMKPHRFSINWKLPLLLYVVTWLTTSGFRFDSVVPYRFFLALLLIPLNLEQSGEAWNALGATLYQGLAYSVPLMTILTCHELGHFLQTRSYRIRSSLPYFIPMPFGPFGTLGAVIAMDDRIPNTRALFDIGISGPLAGLIPTLIFLYFGIKWSSFGPASIGDGMVFGEPLLFQYVSHRIYGPMPPDVSMYVHPVGMAAWVGLFLTSLNLLPFSQLDGGHIFYALVGPRAARYSLVVFYSVILLVIFFQLWHWVLILILLSYIGVSHPPTANDAMPLTPFRRILGWLTLSFVLIGFTPTPIKINEPAPKTPGIYCQAESNPVSGVVTNSFPTA